MVIVKYLKEAFPPLPINFDDEIEILSSLKRDDYLQHFENCLVEFYKDSTLEERNSFLKFAVDLIKADNKITESENVYLNLIYDRWDFE